MAGHFRESGLAAHWLQSAAVAKRTGATRKSSGSPALSKRDRRSRNRARRQRGELEPTDAQRLAEDCWIEWGGELIWVFAYTSGGAPYGLRICDFDRADLEMMELDVAALEDAGRLSTAESSIDQSNAWLRDDDVPF